MKKTVLAALAVISLGSALYANHVPEGNYTIDSYHSKVGFEVPHLVVSSVEGRFNSFSGTVTVVKDNVDVVVFFKMLTVPLL